MKGGKYLEAQASFKVKGYTRFLKVFYGVRPPLNKSFIYHYLLIDIDLSQL